MLVRGKPFLVKIPMIENNSLYLHALATAKIHYRLEHTSPTKKRGRKKAYKDISERNHAYYMLKNWELSSQLLKFPILR